MRLLILILGVLGLAACQMTAAKGPAAGINPIVGDAIAVTSLDAPVADAAPVPDAPVADAPLGPLEPAKDAVTTPDATPPADTAPAEVVPAVPKSPEQETCERKGDSWSRVGDNQSQACVHITRDAGKQCRRDRDCESVCLARSGTCAPLSPLFGCNEVLQDDGRRMTQCLD
jgi:hypothetical protein